MRRSANPQAPSLTPQASIRCAIYTRKSTEENLDQSFNSLDAQREASEAFIASRKSLNWVCLPERYDDGGFTGGNLERPALQRLLRDIEARALDCVIVHRVDRLSRSLLDFARIMEILERNGVSLSSVTQPFDSTDSMGRLTLNVLLSFAQFEREIIAERTRYKMLAARRKGKWLGGPPVLGYDVDHDQIRLIINPDEAVRVKAIFNLYLEHKGVTPVVRELDRLGWGTKSWRTKNGKIRESRPFDKNGIFRMLENVVYAGKVQHQGKVYPGEHEAIIDQRTWDLVEETLKKNGASTAGTARNRHGALLRGILRCSACDAAMVHTFSAKKTRRYRYYVCATAQQKGWAACPTKSVNAQEIEDAVVNHIRGIGRNGAVIRKTVGRLKQQTDTRTRELTADQRILEREVKRLRSDIDDAVRDILKPGNEGKPEYVTRLSDLQDQVKDKEDKIGRIKAEIDELEAQGIDEAELAQALGRFDPMWDELTPAERTRMIRLLVRSVGYDGTDVFVNFHSDGIKELCREGVEREESGAACEMPLQEVKA